MAKIVKAKKKNQKQTVIAGKYGLKFSSEVTPYLRKVIEEGIKERLEGKTVFCNVDEFMKMTRSLHD